jgi:Calcineurin-like phosphoesterase
MNAARLRMLTVASLPAVAVLLAGCCRPTKVDVAYAFTVVAPADVSASELVARAIITAPKAHCPDVEGVKNDSSHVKIGMTRLPAPSGTIGFDGITVCRVPLPAGLERATVGAKPLPLLSAGTPHRIAVFGDTGCRIKKDKAQACNSPTEWPLAAAAKEIADVHPQLILNTGDFFYREAPCPPQEACAGSPAPNTGQNVNEDTWDGWNADWFKPAHPIFAAAPLMIARGNHEACQRAGTGYFLLLDPGIAPPDTCQRAAPDSVPGSRVAERTWVARLGAIDIVNLDSSQACDAGIEATPKREDPCGVEGSVPSVVYASAGQAAARLLRSEGTTSWLLTHRPVYAWQLFPKTTAPQWAVRTMQVALGPTIDAFDEIISGDLHFFQAVQLAGRPGQLTLGDGATKLDEDKPGAQPPEGPDGEAWKRGSETSFTFGWMLLLSSVRPGVFIGLRYQTDAGLWGHCRLAPRTLFCREA